MASANRLTAVRTEDWAVVWSFEALNCRILMWDHVFLASPPSIYRPTVYEGSRVYCANKRPLHPCTKPFIHSDFALSLRVRMTQSDHPVLLWGNSRLLSDSSFLKCINLFCIKINTCISTPHICHIPKCVILSAITAAIIPTYFCEYAQSLWWQMWLDFQTFKI